jgi:tripartite-type tricarboxylate transporter receptor subunit TctC
MRCRRLFAALIAGALAAIPGEAPAAAYPEKPVTLIVPYPPGGVSDLMARPLAEGARAQLPQPIVIVNRAGGGGTVGIAEVVQAPPDGYTIGLGSAGVNTIQPHLTDLPYKTPSDYEPVIRLGSVPVVFAVRSDAPWRTMRELLDFAKANPEKVRVANPGVGTIQYMIHHRLREMTGAALADVPFAGGGEALPALLGGHVEGLLMVQAPLRGHVQAGRVRVLATVAEGRSPMLPEAPTLRELGVDIAKEEFLFILAPKGTPKERVQALHVALKKAMESDGFKKFASERGFVLGYEGPEDLKRRLERDYAFFGELVKKLNLKASK